MLPDEQGSGPEREWGLEVRSQKCSHHRTDAHVCPKGLSLVHGAQLSVLSDVCLISMFNDTCRQGFCDEFPIGCAETSPINLVGHLSARNEQFRYLVHILV